MQSLTERYETQVCHLHTILVTVIAYEIRKFFMKLTIIDIAIQYPG